MLKMKFIFFFFISCFCFVFSQVPDETIGVVNVHNYFEMLMNNSIDEQNGKHKEFLHPDAIISGAYNANFYILHDNYEVTRVWNEVLDLNCMIPGEEEFLAVELAIPAYGKVNNGKFSPESVFHNIFYLSRSTGELKILDTSESIYFMMSLEDSIEWLEDNNKDWDYYKPAYNDLLAYLEEKDIPIPE